MKRFNYKAKDKTGRLVTGEVEAATEKQAAKLVRDKGYVVIAISLKINSPFDFVRRFRERITPSDVTTFTRQLSTMINAGLPITECLTILRLQSNGQMQKIVAQILADIEAGESLSTAISRHSLVFHQHI
jgi:type IV pilus assembly protein PilC